MSDAKRFVIDVIGSARAPSGCVSAADGTRIAFDGWLQLLSALENAFDDGAATTPADTHRSV